MKGYVVASTEQGFERECEINVLKQISDNNTALMPSKGAEILNLISAGILKGWGNSDSSLKNHCIVWDEPVCKVDGGNINPKDSDALIELKLFCWGSVDW